MATIVVDRKRLTKTDIAKRLAFPTGNLGDIPIPEGELDVTFEAIDTIQKAWNFRLTKRDPEKYWLTKRNPEKYYPKPVVTGEWLQFVREKGLKVGDRIILKKETDQVNGDRYTIKAEREIFKYWVNID